MITKIAKSGLTFALVRLENRIFSYKAYAWHQDYTGLKHWVSFNFSFVTALNRHRLRKSKVSLIIIIITTTFRFYF